MNPTSIKNFWKKVEKRSDDECWLWTAAKDNGYGRCRDGYKNVRAHRFSYELHKGMIKDGLIVCHKCDNPSCVNPKHLFLGSHLDNARDRVKKGRNRNQFGENNSSSKLCVDDVLEIRKLYKDGHKQVYLSSIFGVGQDNISRIINRKIWQTI